VVGSPSGWKSQSDGEKYVTWVIESEAFMLPPRQSLGGFQIQGLTVNSVSSPYTLAGWEGATVKEEKGRATFGSVASPSK
jgi:hypothetical protein